MNINYQEVIDQLAASKEPFGLLTMQATSTTGRLTKALPGQLKALFSAEHGFFGDVQRGEKIVSAWHPYWNCPIHSLYGDHRKPTPEMLEGISRLVIDLCDIGVRCYTYLASLKYTLEACAEYGIAVTVLDRPIPVGGILDGPMRRPNFDSIVAPINVPFCHGMTPGECAMWIREQEGLKLDLTIAKVQSWNHFNREPWTNFVPPSPSIKSWDSAALYPMTVFTEAYPAIDCDRYGALSFRIIGAPWIKQKPLMAALEPGLTSCGVAMRPYRYMPTGGSYKDQRLDGILFSISNPEAFYPVTAGILVYTALVQQGGDKVFRGGSEDWFNKLLGSTEVRDALAGGKGLDDVFQKWIDDQDAYLNTKIDLYQ